MKRNLTRETRHSDDSFTTLPHLKEELESNQGEIVEVKNEIQRSNSVKEEMESKQGEILALKDKLQESKTIVGHYWTFKIVVEKSLRNNT